MLARIIVIVVKIFDRATGSKPNLPRRLKTRSGKHLNFCVAKILYSHIVVIGWYTLAVTIMLPLLIVIISDNNRKSKQPYHKLMLRTCLNTTKKHARILIATLVLFVLVFFVMYFSQMLS